MKSKQKAEIAGAPRGYKRAVALMDAVYSEFMAGASISRLARKHSQSRHIVEFILRVKLFRGSRR